MASIDDLKNVLKETLDNRGVLSQVRARIRAEVFSALDDNTEVKPVLSNENMFINELIREYFEFNSYKYTNTVLTAESGQPKDPIDRQFLAAELNMRETNASRQLPILYGLVSYFLDNKHANETPERDLNDSPLSAALTNGKSGPDRHFSAPHTKKDVNFSELSNDEENLSSMKGLLYRAKTTK